MKTSQDLAREHLERICAENPEIAERQRRMVWMQDNANSVADIVAAYRAGVMPQEAGAVQIRETEQAIYAACHMVLTVFLRKLDGMGDDGAQMDRWVEKILDECQDYARSRALAGMATGPH